MTDAFDGSRYRSEDAMIERDAQQFFHDYAAAWRVGTADALIPHWDSDHFRFYKAEEIAQVYDSWADVVAYWRMNEGINETAILVFSEIRIKPLSDGWASCAMRMRWDIRFTPTAPGLLAGRAMGGDNHVLTQFHNGRLTGWSETPDAPVLYVWRLYEQEARGV